MSVVRTLARLTEAQAELVTLDPALFAVVVHETVKLQNLYDVFVRGGAASSVRKVAHANVRDELRAVALAQRDVVRAGLVQVLGATRALDLQDGRVLVLLDALVGSMQEAHGANAAIELPEYATLASRYRSRPRSARGKGRVGKAPAVNPEPNAKPE